MDEHILPTESEYTECTKLFLEFIQAFKALDHNNALFPKKCRTCGQVFRTYREYVVCTIPKGHVFEDGSEVMGCSWTMLYRHCTCGNTLVLTLTDETFPDLDRFWASLRQLAESTGKPLKEIVHNFREECDRHIQRDDLPKQ